MYKEGSGEPSRLEDEYFYKKDRELIEKMKSAEKAKKDILERTAHYHKCSKCGHDMEERVREDVSLLCCHHCESMHISLSTLENLGHHGRLNVVLNDLRDYLSNLKESA
jgi:Zn finger protein HypA/HybF involved in hydrogenase expression